MLVGLGAVDELPDETENLELDEPVELPEETENLVIRLSWLRYRDLLVTASMR